jgi:hypothetical protein
MTAGGLGFFEFQMTSMLRDREKPAGALIYSGLH